MDPALVVSDLRNVYQMGEVQVDPFRGFTRARCSRPRKRWISLGSVTDWIISPLSFPAVSSSGLPRAIATRPGRAAHLARRRRSWRRALPSVRRTARGNREVPTTTAVITHNARDMADRVLSLADGRIVSDRHNERRRIPGVALVRALDRKLLRDLSGLRMQAIAIALFVASGTAVLLLPLSGTLALRDFRHRPAKFRRFVWPTAARP